MATMKLILRWHGDQDPISLREYAQVPNLSGIVTSLYHMPLGVEWDREELLRLKHQIESFGLSFEIVDSFRIHEDIKRGCDTRDALIEVYRKNIRTLSGCGIRIICYNFMPVFDWTRTNMARLLPDGSDCLSFEADRVRAIDPEKGIDLPGWGTNHTPAELRALLDSYAGIGQEALWENCRYFLRAVLPTAEACGVKLALHPDDPPRDIFGLPRIAKNAADYRRILFSPDVESPSNTMTFCCGSLGSGAGNDLPAMIREFGAKGKIPFVHFRNVQRNEKGDFYESGHQTGCGSSDMGEIMRALCEMEGTFFLRPDHGRRIWNEAWSVRETVLPDGAVQIRNRPDGWNGTLPAAGYGLFDRALGAAYAQGLWEGIQKEMCGRTRRKEEIQP